MGSEAATDWIALERRSAGRDNLRLGCLFRFLLSASRFLLLCSGDTRACRILNLFHVWRQAPPPNSVFHSTMARMDILPTKEDPNILTFKNGILRARRFCF
jgi:hypothetical protein